MEAAPPGGEQPAQPKRKHRRGAGKTRQRHRATPGKRPTPERAADDLEREKRLGRVIDLRVEGNSIRAIAAKLNLSVGTVHKDIEEGLERIVDRNDSMVRRERAISLERIEVATKGLFPRLKKGDCEAINAFAKLDARRAKLLGLDVPIKAELSGPDGSAIPVAAPTSQLESKLDDLFKRLAGGNTAAAAGEDPAPAVVADGDAPGQEPGGSAGAQSESP